MMKKPVKISAVAGISLFILAALFSISLFTAVVDFGPASGVRASVFYRFGKLLAGTYGFCSALIPLFLLVSGIESFASSWNSRKGTMLLGSVFPFFTLNAAEKICRKYIETSPEQEIPFKLFATLTVALLAVLFEYVLLWIIGKFFDSEKTPSEEPDVQDHFAVEEDYNEPSEEEIPAETEKTFAASPVQTEVRAAEIPVSQEPVKSADFSETTGDFENKIPEADNEPNPFDHVFDDIEESQMTLRSEDEEEPAEDITETAEPADEEFEEPVVPAETDVQEEEFEEPEVPEDMTVQDEEAPATEEDDFDDAADEINSADIDFDSDSETQEESFEAPEVEDDAESPTEQAEIIEIHDVPGETPSIVDEFENKDPEIETEKNFSEEIDPSVFGLDFDEDNESPAEDDNEDVFAMMDQDAAENPVFDDEKIEEGISKELPNDIFDEELTLEDTNVNDGYEFDPSAKPVVDADGNPYEDDEIPEEGEYSDEEINLDEVPQEIRNAIRTNGQEKIHSSLEKTVFGNTDDEEAVELPEVKEEPKPEKKAPKLRMSNYKVPTDLLMTYENGEYWVVDYETKQKAEDLKQTLSEFNIEVEVTGIRKGPVVTMFEVLPAPGVNINKIRSLQDNIALRLAATSVRIISPIPGKSAVGIEIPNKKRAIVSFREIMEQKNPDFEKMAIPVILGKDISGEPQLIDLAKTPHLLIAGSTGAGKSVCVNSLILSILYKRSPQQVKMILIDPKVVELKLYNDIPHLLTPVITEPKKALQSLQYCLCEMERRYALLDGMGVRDISNYNKRIVERHIATEKLPYIVVIIDEFADLMATTGRELESNVARLAAMSRAVGIHLVLATQRPSVNVITGLIKANIPSRIAFMVASRTDSNIIIDQIGAEKLLGKGDMLYASATDPFPVRIQGTLVVDDEVEKVVDYVKQYGEPDYIDDEIFVDDEDEGGDTNPGLFSDGEDPLYDQALQIVIQAGKASASYIQRRLKIGYNRAARLVEEMEERGIVGPANGSKPREVIQAP